MDYQLSQTLKQTITPQMIHSMELLAMNAQEVAARVNELALENPVMDIEDPDYSGISEREVDLQRKLDWLSRTDRQNRVYYQDDYDAMDNTPDSVLEEDTLSFYLHSQIHHKGYTKREFGVISYLIESLDERGYLTETLDEICKAINADLGEVQKMMGELKALDPAGVGASDLSECLSLQIERIATEDDRDFCLDIAKRIVSGHLQELAKHHYSNIAKKLSVDISEIERAAGVISSLNPRPASGFADRTTLHYITPDIVVVMGEDAFTILVNEYTYPRISVNSYYEKMLETETDKETVNYLRERLNKVKSLQSELKMRGNTISRVAHFIVERQKAFFLKGPGNKVPMKLSDIASALDIHESTVSRTLSGKYLQCSYGIFPLNYFLESVTLRDDRTGEDTSRESVFNKLKEVIEGEDKKKPLSDEAIAKALNAKGIDISRRTVNKYRGILGIPDKAGRKEV